MPTLKYVENGIGTARVTISAFTFNANKVSVKIGDTVYTATPANRYYYGGYYYTTLKIRAYFADITKPFGATSCTSVTEFTITVRSRTYTFGGATFNVGIKSELTTSAITPARSGAYLYSSKKYAQFKQYFVYQGGYSSANGNSVNLNAAGMTEGTIGIDQVDLYRLYTAKNYSHNTGKNSSVGRYTYNTVGDCTLF